MTYFPGVHPIARTAYRDSMAPRNDTIANRLLLLVFALLAGVVYLLYRLKGRSRT